MSKVYFDRKTMDLNKYLNFVNTREELVILWNGEQTFNGKSLVSVINALVGRGKTAIEIITDNDRKTDFLNRLTEIGVTINDD